jgi:hypothetical protein
MALGSMEYKERMVEFGRNLSQVADDLYEAIEEDLPRARRDAIIAAGERKIRDFSALLDDVSGPKKAEVEKTYGDQVRDIEQFLKTLKKKAGQ